jgi:hypothetical protein
MSKHFRPIDRDILHWPCHSIVSNITVPLLGLVDLTIVGHHRFGSGISPPSPWAP